MWILDMDPANPGPDERPPAPPSYFGSDHFSLLLGVLGSIFLVVGVWLYGAGYTFDATAAFLLAILGILSGALTFRKRRRGPEA
jgi:hypothetical protein